MSSNLRKELGLWDNSSRLRSIYEKSNLAFKLFLKKFLVLSLLCERKVEYGLDLIPALLFIQYLHSSGALLFPKEASNLYDHTSYFHIVKLFLKSLYQLSSFFEPQCNSVEKESQQSYTCMPKFTVRLKRMWEFEP
jgi:hypothetical protein